MYEQYISKNDVYAALTKSMTVYVAEAHRARRGTAQLPFDNHPCTPGHTGWKGTCLPCSWAKIKLTGQSRDLQD